LRKFVRIYLVPGAVFQSIVIGGGYGTGREIVQYFTRLGPYGGLLAGMMAFAVFALVIALTFEIGRRFRAYDYRAFFKVLLGEAWFLYEIVAAFMFMLLFAVLIAAASGVLHDGFGLPAWIGIALVFTLIGVLEFFGRETVMRVLTFWSVVLYAVFIAFLIEVYQIIPDAIESAFDAGGIDRGWALSGFQYAMYNMMAIPIVLYVTHDFETRGQAIGSGITAAAIAMIPAMIFHVAFSGAGAEISAAPIPVFAMMNAHAMHVLAIAFSIMLFGTLIETGAGVLQGINERIDKQLVDYRREPLGKWGHTVVAVGFMGLALAVSSIGIVDLIAKAYGTMAWCFFAVYFVPLVTAGVWRLARTDCAD